MNDDVSDTALLAEISDSLFRILSLSPRPEVRERCYTRLAVTNGAEFQATVEQRLKSIFRVRDCTGNGAGPGPANGARGRSRTSGGGDGGTHSNSNWDANDDDDENIWSSSDELSSNDDENDYRSVHLNPPPVAHRYQNHNHYNDDDFASDGYVEQPRNENERPSLSPRWSGHHDDLSSPMHSPIKRPRLDEMPRPAAPSSGLWSSDDGDDLPPTPPPMPLAPLRALGTPRRALGELSVIRDELDSDSDDDAVPPPSGWHAAPSTFHVHPTVAPPTFHMQSTVAPPTFHMQSTVAPPTFHAQFTVAPPTFHAQSTVAPSSFQDESPPDTVPMDDTMPLIPQSTVVFGPGPLGPPSVISSTVQSRLSIGYDELDSPDELESE